jgi:hypothetical protein
MARRARVRRGARAEGEIQGDPFFLFIFASSAVIWSKPDY